MGRQTRVKRGKPNCYYRGSKKICRKGSKAHLRVKNKGR